MIVPVTIPRSGILLAVVLVALSMGVQGASAANSITSPDTIGDVGSNTSSVLDAAGHPVISYFDVDNWDLKVIHCNDPNCAGGDESITSPDTASDVGLTSSLTLDGSGNPVVSYYDHGNDDLKLLHCNDPNCAGGGESITAPDTAGDVGNSSSLELDSSGNPVVSYHDGPDDGVPVSENNLKVLHCGNPNCDSGNSIYFADVAGDVGNSSSLELDSSGNPVVSYYDATNGDLKVLHCFDPNCTTEVPTDLGDEDGVPDTSDLCPGTIAGPVDANGCSDAQVDPDGDNVCDPGAPSGGPSACTGSDNCPSTANPGQENQDGDQWGDACENCPTVATPWVVPVGDDDCDGVPTTNEVFVGTDPNDACANTAAANDEADDKWPTDMNDNQRTNTLDVAFYVPTLGTSAPGPPYVVRLDLTMNGVINTLDVAKFVPVLNDVCTALP